MWKGRMCISKTYLLQSRIRCCVFFSIFTCFAPNKHNHAHTNKTEQPKKKEKKIYRWNVKRINAFFLLICLLSFLICFFPFLFFDPFEMNAHFVCDFFVRFSVLLLLLLFLLWFVQFLWLAYYYCLWWRVYAISHCIWFSSKPSSLQSNECSVCVSVIYEKWNEFSSLYLFLWNNKFILDRYIYDFRKQSEQKWTMLCLAMLGYAYASRGCVPVYNIQSQTYI